MNVLLPLIVFLSSWGIMWYLTHPASSYRPLDYPNARSLHQSPVPRSGGLAILAGIVIGFACWAWMVPFYQNSWWLLGIPLIAVVSFIDDKAAIHPLVRLIAHLLAALLLVPSGLVSESMLVISLSLQLPTWMAMLVSIVSIVWMINLYNFMDGIDGLAGGMSIIGFGVLSILGFHAGQSLYAGLCLIVVAATFGFLLFNFPPARIFMGDVGSSLLGYLAAIFIFWGQNERIFPFWIAILVFSPFIVDASVTLLKRIVRVEKIWEAHREHYYQRLILLGWSHRRTALAEYSLMLMAGISATVASSLPTTYQFSIVIAWVILYLSLIFIIELRDTSK
ncbi:MAG: glycosyltransferase family 4 protein [Methylococcales bacterium]